MRQSGAERLEDGLEDVARVLAVDQPDVKRQPRRLRERLEEARSEVAAEPSRARLGQIDVARDERPLRDLERDLGQCFLRRQERRAVSIGSVGAQQAGEGLAERPARFRNLGLSVARGKVESKSRSGRCARAASAGDRGPECP